MVVIRGRMRRVSGVLPLALFLFGVAWIAPWEPRVPLLTGEPPGYGGPGCFTNSAAGPLVIDPEYGTAIIDGDMRATTPTPIMWRPGFTARWTLSALEVLGPLGNVVATTGRSYRIEGGYVGYGAGRAFWACGFVNPR